MGVGSELTGRIEYIEPNNLNGAGINGIPFPYENYNIYVDLEVHKNNRYSCGIINDDTQRFSTENGTLRIMGGTNGIFTTNYTDAAYLGDVKDNTNECVGVESINISYDKNFIPQVDIKFVDVRGLSFFTPQETAEVAKIRDGKRHDIGSSLLKQIFVLPPADFYLRAKGFYGRSIKFKLIVDNIKVAFNETTGNFDLDVKLIGKMFGIYVDLPLSFISVAPYMEYVGNKYWENKKLTTFRYSDGVTPLSTFIELKEKVSSYNQNMEKGSEEDAQEMNKNSSEIITLTDLSRSYHYFKECLVDYYGEDFEYYEFNDFKTSLDGFLFNNVIIGPVKDYTNDRQDDKDWLITEYVNYRLEIDKINASLQKNSRKSSMKEKVLSAAEECLKKIDKFNSENDNILVTPDILPDNEEELKNPKSNPVFSKIKDTKVIVTFDADGNPLIDYGGIRKFAKNNDPDFNEKINKKIIDSISPSDAKKGNTFFFEMHSFYDSNFEKELINMSGSIELENAKKLGIVPNEYTKDMMSILGFVPTIHNVFTMIFAHMETFIQSFYRMLANIKSDEHKRTFEALGLDHGVETDLPVKSGFVPPFPALYRSRKRQDSKTFNSYDKDEYIKPGEYYNGIKVFDSDSFEELKFVDSLYEAAKSSSERLANLDKINSDNNAFEINDGTDYLSTSLSDVLVDGKRANPYYFIFADNGKKEAFDEAIPAAFILRYYNSTIGSPREYTGDRRSNNKNIKNKAEAFGFLEAINVAKAFKGEKKDIQDYLNEKDNSLLKKILYEMKKDTSGHVWNIPNSNKVFDSSGNMTWFSTIDENKNKYTYFPIMFSGFNDLANVSHNGEFLKNERYYWACLNHPKEIKNSFYIFEDDLFGECTNEINSDKMTATFNNGSVPKKTVSSYLSIYNTFKFEDNDGRELYRFDLLNGTTVRENCLAHKQAIYFGDWKVNPDKYQFMYISQIYDETIPGNIFTSPTVFSHKSYTGLYQNKQLITDNVAILAKAYLFLFSMPLIYDSENRSFGKERNRTLCSLLQEGAYYWRYYYMFNKHQDPIWNKFSDFKAAEKDELYKIEKYTASLCFISDDSANSYVKGPEIDGENGATYERRKKLEEMFIEWARGKDFNILLKFLENTDYTKNKSYFKYVPEQIDEGFRKYMHYYDPLKGVYSDISGFTIGLEILYKYDSFISPELPVHKIIGNLLYKYYTVIDYSEIKNEVGPLVEEDLKAAYTVFKKTLKKYFGEKRNEEKEEPKKIDRSIEQDIKLSIYLTLKRLYDFHFCTENKERWIIEPIVGNPLDIRPYDSDFNNFIFIDQFYNNIGDSILANIEKVAGHLSGKTMNTQEEADEGNKGQSTYSFMCDVLSDIGMSMQAFPLGNAMISATTIREMFTPDSNNKTFDNSNNFFMCLHRSEPSANLDIPGSDFRNDSFNIADNTGKISDEIPESLQTENGYKVPAFGVSFGKMNQSYFKNIKVNMDNFKETEYSIEAEMNVAARGSRGDREGRLFGQDVYSIFSNYSYTCSVESMGNMQIMPGMLFQLNNIPMFKGAYMIMSVNHKIVPGDITTSFVGVRIKKESLPFVEAPSFIVDNIGKIETAYSIGTSEYENVKINSKSNDEITNMMTNICGAEYEVENERRVVIPRPKFRPYYTYKEGERRVGFADANKIMDFIISVEGGFNPNDAHGGSMYGVTLETYRLYKGQDVTIEDLKAIKPYEWAEIFKRSYWDKIHGDEIKNQSIANILVDLAYNSGWKSVLSLVKSAIPETGDCNSMKDAVMVLNNIPDQKDVFYKIKKARGQRFINLCCKNHENNKYLKGWFNRIKGFIYEE